KVLLGMFLSLKTLYRKRTVIWPFYFYTIIRTLSNSFYIKNSYITFFAKNKKVTYLVVTFYKVLELANLLVLVLVTFQDR
ncbi:hypothetical protein CS914_016120, partial [Enterococcus faecalis]